MQFTVTQHDLNNALSFVVSAIDNKSPLPVLNNVLIKAEGNHLVITATDTELEKQITIPANVSDPGEITVPAKKAMEFAKNAPEDKDIKFNLKNNKAVISSGRSRWNLQTISAEHFPEFMAVKTQQHLSVDVTQLITAMKKCQPMMAQKDARYYLNGMFLDVKPTHINVVATDGHRLAKYEVKSNSGYEREAIIPWQAVSDILKMISKADSAEIDIGDDNISIVVGNMRMISKLIDGRYPDYTRVIPNDSKFDIEINKDEMISAIKRTIPLSHEKHKSMMFVFESGELNITAKNPDQEEAVEVIPASYSGDRFEIGFNGSYVIDALSQVDSDNVLVQLTDSMKSARVDDGNFTAVLMPVRL